MSDVDTLVKVDVFRMEDEHAPADHHRVGTTAEREQRTNSPLP